MVEIPADVAKRLARWIRAASDQAADLAVADLLDPQPPTLHERVDATLATQYRYRNGRMWPDGEDHRAARDAVLEVVADWLAAQPLFRSSWNDDHHRQQRDHDVRLLGGES